MMYLLQCLMLVALVGSLALNIHLLQNPLSPNNAGNCVFRVSSCPNSFDEMDVQAAITSAVANHDTEVQRGAEFPITGVYRDDIDPGFHLAGRKQRQDSRHPYPQVPAESPLDNPMQQPQLQYTENMATSALFQRVQQSDLRPDRITIFALPKALDGTNPSVDRNQRLAAYSWARLQPRPNIILLGKDAGVPELAQEIGALHSADIRVNEYGTPQLDSLFETAYKLSPSKVFVFINSDIVLFDGFVQAQQTQDEFFMSGRRRNFNLTHPVDLSDPQWNQAFHNELNTLRAGKLDVPDAMDYFVHTRGLWPKIPPYAVGRFTWDSWMLHSLLHPKELWGMDPQHKYYCVDATEAVDVGHLLHTYSHAKGGYDGDIFNEEKKQNRELSQREFSGGVLIFARHKLRKTASGEFTLS